ncbi:MAG: peptide MFS transporter [Flammeovirgaceae bacterium]|nr:peptide MFS transporter [Flammeovirgaceae bacterium]
MNLDKSFFGHPRGLATLFFTEMWERFSYYGIRAILILYMTAPVEYGGLGFDIVVAASIYALFTSLAYMANLLGGWIADNIIGQRKAILWGGFLIAAGNFLLFLPGIASFYGGLFVIILGTGLLKPNVSAIVAQIYPDNDDRKDAGFYIFYTGINLGAFIAPLVCSTLAEKVNWQLGFLAACIGMILGIIQFRLGYKFLGQAGIQPAAVASNEDLSGNKKKLYFMIAGFLGLFALLALLNAQGVLSITPTLIADAFQYIFVITVLVFFGWLFFIAKWEPKERDRLIVISVFFFCSALFWSAFEQAGSSLNLFANDFTDKTVPNWMVDVVNPIVGLFTEPMSYGVSFPTGWFQSLNALFIIMLAPIFSSFWKKLGSHEPSSPAKFAWGLIGVGIGFGVIMVAASYATKDNQVSPMWLVSLYFIHTIAELCLSPVGLSKVTSLAPARVVSLMMGVWFLGTSIGNFIAGKMAGFYTTMPLPELFGMVLIYTSGIGIVLLFFVGRIKKLMWGIK